MPQNRLPRVMKHYYPAGRKNHGRPLKRLLDTRDRNGSTSGPTAWQIYDDDDDDDDVNERNEHFLNWYFNFLCLLLVSKHRVHLQEDDFMYRHAIAYFMYRHVIAYFMYRHGIVYFTWVSLSGLIGGRMWVVSWHLDRFVWFVKSFYVLRLYMITLIRTHCSYWTRSLCSDGIARNSMVLVFFQMLKVNQTLDTLILKSTKLLMHVNFYRRPKNL